MSFNLDQNERNIYDILIIGGGPAGLTSAIYAKRANLKVGYIEKDAPGGKIVKTGAIENYTGFKSIEGPNLALEIFNQVNDLNVEYIYGNVINVEKKNKNFYVFTSDGKTRLSKALIVATGMVEKKLGIPGEQEFYGKGVSYCAICDSSLYKDSEVAVIGGGNSAIEEAIYLASVVKKVYVIHRRDEYRADPHAVEMLRKCVNVFEYLSYIPVSINGDKRVDSLTIKNLKTNKDQILNIKCVFCYIGLSPSANFLNSFKDDGIFDDQTNFLLADEYGITKVPGLFIAGDIRNKRYRQIVTAVSDGGAAALSAKEYLLNLNAEKNEQ